METGAYERVFSCRWRGFTLRFVEMVGRSLLGLLLQQPESECLEFKVSFGREAMETLAAFVNAKGGQLLVGVNDSGSVVGVSISEESLQQWLNQVKLATSPSVIPDVELFTWQGRDVVLFSVPAYPVKPVSLKGKY